MLKICATPIGNLGDITLRALEELKKADAIICEDTRQTQKLLSHYDIHQKMYVYNDHSTDWDRNKIIQKLLNGQTLVMVSDAGMPLVADPGYKLVQACTEAGVKLTVLPGPCAIETALVLSGYPPYPFYFGGFFEKEKYLNDKEVTQVFYVSCHKLIRVLEDLPSHAELAVVREMTKLYEEVRKGTVAELLTHFRDNNPRGEIVLVFKPYAQVATEESIDSLIEKYRDAMTPSELAKTVATLTGRSKKEIYQYVLHNRS